MAIILIQKDITEITNGVIVHGCNAKGVMGSGVAKAIKKKWPGAYMAYRTVYIEDGLFLGDTIWYQANENLFVVNAITQETYGTDGKVYANIDAIDNVLYNIISAVRGTDLQNKIYMPMIGCGLGGLDWNDAVEPVVRDLLAHESDDVDIRVCSLSLYNFNTGKYENIR